MVMEEALLGGCRDQQEGKWKTRWGGFGEELKKLSYMAVPMVAVSVSQYLLQVISMVIVGHLGELSLSGIAIASSITNVTGISLIVILYLSLFFLFHVSNSVVEDHTIISLERNKERVKST